MIYEIALWFRNRGHNVTRNEIVGNLLMGFLMVAMASLLVFVAILGNAPFPIMIVSGFGGILLGLLIGLLVIYDCYPAVRPNALAISIGFVLGAATVTGFFALLPLLWILIIPIIILAEVLFFVLDGREPAPNESVFWFTAKRKIHVLAQSAVIMLTVFGFWKGAKEFITWSILNWHAVKMFFGVVGSVVVVIVVLYLYIKLNSLKYNRNGERQQQVPQPPQLATQVPVSEKKTVAPRPAGRSRATTPKRGRTIPKRVSKPIPKVKKVVSKARVQASKLERIKIGTVFEEKPRERQTVPEFERLNME